MFITIVSSISLVGTLDHDHNSDYCHHHDYMLLMWLLVVRDIMIILSIIICTISCHNTPPR